MMAVLDFDDILYHGTTRFNLCTKCGLAFPTKLWWDRDKGTTYEPEKIDHLQQPWEAFTKKESKAKSGNAIGDA